MKEKEIRIGELENTLKGKETYSKELEGTIGDMDRRIKEIDNTLKDKDAQIVSLDASLKEKEFILTHIYNSHGWKALLLYYKIRDKVLPHNTTRRLFAKIIFNAITKPRGFFKSLTKRNIYKFAYYFKTAEPSTLEEKVVRKISEMSPGGIMPLVKNITLEEVENLNFPYYSKPLVSIIIPVWNKWTFTYNCLKSLLENTNGVPYEIIVIDNASTDETVEVLPRINGIKVIRNRENEGFIEACNKGSKKSKGRYLLFLNNDTQVTQGWLKSVTDLAESEEKIGAVGAKLVYSDGKLQEAGGIVWNDPVNLAWNYGRYDDPNKWEYNYVKEVDYCSGACLLVKKDIFKRVGLFDKQYAPAYCEDTDMAFSIRNLGYKVMYQPKAEIIHFEGTTAGTDTSQGTKRFQVINQEKFYQKWRKVLEKNHFRNGENVFLARDRSQNKHVLLFIDHYVPTWDKDAGSVRMYEYLKIFLDMGFKIIFWPDNLYKMEPYTTKLQQMGIEVIYGHNDFKDYIKKFGRYINVVYLSRPHIAIDYIDYVKQYTKAKVFYDCHDLHFLREQRRAKTENKPQLFEEVKSWKQKEFYLMENSDISVVLSDVEKKIIEEENPNINVVVLPYVQQLNKATRKYEEKNGIVFIGGFAHMPNEDGVLWFTEEIFPIIKRRIPGIKFVVLGSYPTEKVLSLKSDDIVVTGFVEDVSDYFQNTRVFVAPLRYGAGLKGKNIQAMSYGLPVVTTTIGAEGMGLKDGENAMVADTSVDFAEKVVELYTNKDRWNMLSQNSQRFIKENNSSEMAKEKFSYLFNLKELSMRGKQ